MLLMRPDDMRIRFGESKMAFVPTMLDRHSSAQKREIRSDGRRRPVVSARIRPLRCTSWPRSAARLHTRHAQGAFISVTDSR